jgi:hypothetical protein
VDELNVLHDKEVIEQKNESPNMAVKFRDFLVKLRNRNQVTRAALEMWTPKKDVTRASAAGIEATEKPHVEEKKDKAEDNQRICDWYSTSEHNPDKLFLCAKFLEYRQNHEKIPDWLCKSHLGRKSAKCEEGICHKWKATSGQTGSYCCGTCHVHRNLGTCTDCLESEKKFTRNREMRIAAKVC